MSTRKIKDAKDLNTGELIYFKGHARATFLSDGRNIEEAIANKMDKVELAKVATSGSYEDLENKPTIPAAVTESTVSGWGFTKNSGTYSKPADGIPASDLDSDVQTKLDNIENLNTEVNNIKDTLEDIASIPLVEHGTADTTFALTPNTFHVWDAVTSLSLTLGSEKSGVVNEYLFQFASGATATTLSLPSSIKWTKELEIEPNKIYQISILKGLASVLSWEA